jgi:cytoskeletal protein CcmA (bactofilin family)
VKSNYGNDIINGREVAPLVVSGDRVLAGVHQGTVHVEGGHFELRGTLQGTLSVYRGATASISGTQQGSVYVASGASVTVAGAIEGSTHVEQRAELVVEPRGRLAGSLHNDGRVIVRGIFGGARSGLGEFVLEDQGTVKQPIIRDGIYYYEW